jgi:predicted DNA-binding transcriptional regulator AlpA
MGHYTPRAQKNLGEQAQAVGASPLTDDLLTSRGVRKTLGDISPMSLWRFRRNLDFPPPDLTINRTHFWRRATVQSWIARQAAKPAVPPGPIRRNKDRGIA